ncbi:MAG TPA: glycosyltransferase family 39 protein [Chthoniobacter sp.]|jgi:4-amino-4-deoxy-L-arabinose transferase-like glycosyltransferase
MPMNSRAWMLSLIVFLAAFALAFGWQWSFGSYHSEFGGHPDEAGHVVTGLFIRDALVESWHYAAGGFHGSPIRFGKEFADRYYTHYPKIGLGVWPPLFYLVQSAWTLPFGATRAGLFLLLCGLAALLALLLFRVLREEFGIAQAALTAAVLISLPLVRTYYGMVMAETLSALLIFGAIVAFGNFVDREKRRDAIWFGVLASAAILTKGTGLALALAAPLALLFTRRLALLKRPALWGAVLIVTLFAGPWTWATRNLGRGGWEEPSPSWSFTRGALPYYVDKLAITLGALLGLLFLVGLSVRIVRGGPRRGLWAAAGSLIIAVIIFQSIAPVGKEARHLIPIVPAALMFSLAGFDFLARRSRGWPKVALVVVVLAGVGWALFPFKTKGDAGYQPLADKMLAESSRDDVALISSDVIGEGAFIADVALHEQRPGHTIQRASKSLAASTWSGSGYTPLFTTDEQLFQFLTNGEIRYLIVDDAVPASRRREHHDQIRRVVEQHPDRFAMIAEAEAWREGVRQQTPVRLYKISAKN